jgi:radical SAM protein with 4Fe4S-binding SPASM domain
MALKIKTLEEAEKLRACLENAEPFELREIKIHLTGRCNLRCPPCGNWKNCYSEDTLIDEDIERVIDEGKTLGLRNVKFFGGEPLMHPRFGYFVKYAHERGMHTNVISNATLLTPERVREIFDACLDEMIVSIDGPDPELNDLMRGVPGTFERIVQGLKEIQKQKVLRQSKFTLSDNVAVTRMNFRGLPELFEFCANQGISAITLNPVVRTHRLKSYNEEAEQFARLPLTADEIREYNQEIAPSLLEKASALHIQIPRDKVYIFGESEADIERASKVDYVSRLGRFHCFRPFYYTIIRENGDVVACNRVKDTRVRPIGNIHEQSLTSLWNSERYKLFRQSSTPVNFEDCVQCCYVTALLNKKLTEKLEAV